MTTTAPSTSCPPASQSRSQCRRWPGCAHGAESDASANPRAGIQLSSRIKHGANRSNMLRYPWWWVLNAVWQQSLVRQVVCGSRVCRGADIQLTLTVHVTRRRTRCSTSRVASGSGWLRSACCRHLSRRLLRPAYIRSWMARRSPLASRMSLPQRPTPRSGNPRPPQRAALVLL